MTIRWISLFLLAALMLVPAGLYAQTEAEALAADQAASPEAESGAEIEAEPQTSAIEPVNDTETDTTEAESSTKDPDKVEAQPQKTVNDTETTAKDTQNAVHDEMEIEKEAVEADTEIQREQAQQNLAAEAEKTEMPVEPEMPHVNKHEGFFVRFGLGLGFGYAHGIGEARVRPYEDDYRSDYYYRIVLDDPRHAGLTSGMQLALGHSLKENLILHFDASLNGILWEKKDPTSQIFLFGQAGIGVTYYFMPDNVFVSASFGAAWMLMYLDDEYKESQRADEIAVGPGLSLMVGKEWWVAKNTAVGIALQANYSYTRKDHPSREDLEFHQVSGLALVTVTYN